MIFYVDSIDTPENLRKLKLHDLCIISTLGVGGFGRAELVSRVIICVGVGCFTEYYTL